MDYVAVVEANVAPGGAWVELMIVDTCYNLLMELQFQNGLFDFQK